MIAKNSPFVGILVAVIGICFAIWGGMVVREAHSAKDWPSASGTILSSEVKKTFGGSTNNKKWYYQAEIKYQYTVDGLDYESDRINFATYEHKFKSEVFPTGIKNKHPKGKTVPVYYDPIDPNKAVLNRETNMKTYAGLIAGLLASIVGVVLFIRSEN